VFDLIIARVVWLLLCPPRFQTIRHSRTRVLFRSIVFARHFAVHVVHMLCSVQCCHVQLPRLIVHCVL